MGKKNKIYKNNIMSFYLSLLVDRGENIKIRYRKLSGPGQ